MKNIHILPTDKPSRLCKDGLGTFHITESMISKVSFFKNQNIYITSDEVIKEGDWMYDSQEEDVLQRSAFNDINGYIKKYCKKIILTTDDQLIKDGVQAIPDEFLKWFVKNPSCEKVLVINLYGDFNPIRYDYQIIIPKEEPKQEYNNLNYGGGFTEEDIKRVSLKQETLEEARANAFIDFAKSNEDISMYSFVGGWDKCAKWQQERSYSEEEVYNITQQLRLELKAGVLKWQEDFEFDLTDWFEQFKKK